jgi:hypothetical protein
LKKSDILELFGSAVATAKFFGISHVAVVNWGELIPKARAYELKCRNKKAKVDMSLYDK